jgi:glutathione S-transferase
LRQDVSISGEASVKRFTLYGSPHSLPTYKVALMLRLSGEPFSFRYLSFQKGMHKTPDFLALSRWGQVPVLVDGERVHLQSAAIVEHLAGTLGRFQGPGPAARQAVREWLYWDADVLFPPIFNCYAVQLGQRNRSMSSRRLPTIIAGVPRRRCQYWTPTSRFAIISVLPSPPSRTCSATAT